MSRTPEETARLAATVTVETIYGDVGISAKVAMGAARARFHGSDHPRLHALACLAADLAEARASDASRAAGLEVAYAKIAESRAEVATLKAEVESLAAATFAGVREKQAAHIATLERELAEARQREEDATDLILRQGRELAAMRPQAEAVPERPLRPHHGRPARRSGAVSDRDPRLDPRAGDVLRKGRRQRKVRRPGTRGGAVTSEANGCVVYSSQKQWRRWAAGAEVLHVAEEEE